MRRVNDLDKFVATFLGSYKQSADEANTRERNRLYGESLAVNNANAAKRLEIAENNSNALAQHYQNLDANARARIGAIGGGSGMGNDEFTKLITPVLTQLNQPSSTGVAPKTAIPDASPAPIAAPTPAPTPAIPSDDDQMDGAYAHGGLVKHPLHHVAGEAMQGIQERYALHAATGGAVPSLEQRQQLDAFHSNSGAISPEAYSALRQKTGSVEGSLRGLYDFYASKGDKAAAREAASGVMEAARARSMELGQQALGALDQQDYPAAAKNVMAAYSEVRGDPAFTGEVNPHGLGRAVIKNNATGKPVQQLDLNPEILANAAKTMASGSGFYPHMAMAIKSAQPVQHAFSGGLMDQGVDAAMDDEDLMQPATAYDDDLPDVELASSDGATPSAGGQASATPGFIPILPSMNSKQMATVKALNQALMQRAKMNDGHARIQERSEAGVSAHQENKYNDTPGAQLEYAIGEAEKRYGKNKGQLNEALSDLGVQYYGSTHPKARQPAFKADPEDPEGQTRYSRHLAPFTAELDAIENMAAKEKTQKRDDGTAMVDPTNRAVRKLDDNQRAQFLDIANNVYSYTGKSPRQVVRALHQLAYNPEVKPEFNRRTGEWRVGDITLPLESGDLIQLRKINNAERKRYHDEQRHQAAYDRLMAEKDAQLKNYEATRGKNSIRNDGGIPGADDAALPNYGELPGFDPEARLGVR